MAFLLRELLPFVVLLWSVSVSADFNSGCPSWGCLPWGSFALSAKVPVVNSEVSWSSVLENVTSQVSRRGQGCVSNQDVIVCPTSKGYTSIDPESGETLWTYSEMDKPYLPLLDIYGDAIGMDTHNLVYVGNDGKPKHPIAVDVLEPAFGVMVANDSILLITSSKAETAQLVTYLTDGIVHASFQLVGNWERLNGTFIPCSHPVMFGKRAYIVTSFVPLGQNVTMRGWKRLYAIDLLDQMAPRIVVAWTFTFFPETETDFQQDLGVDPISEVDAPVVSFADGIVYVNLYMPKKSRQASEPLESFLFGIRDEGTSASLVFRTPAWYGPLAIYDTYDKPLRQSQAETQRLLWTTPGSPPVINGHDSLNGSVVRSINVDTVAGLDSKATITSKISVTRQDDPEDVLVVGVTDAKGDAHLVVLEASAQTAPRLLWSTKLTEVSGPGVTWAVEGQIVNTVQNKPSSRQIREANQATGRIDVNGIQVENVGEEGKKEQTAEIAENTNSMGRVKVEVVEEEGVGGKVVENVYSQRRMNLEGVNVEVVGEEGWGGPVLMKESVMGDDGVLKIEVVGQEDMFWEVNLKDIEGADGEQIQVEEVGQEGDARVEHHDRVKDNVVDLMELLEKDVGKLAKTRKTMKKVTEEDGVKYGLVFMVMERGNGYTRSHVKAIY